MLQTGYEPMKKHSKSAYVSDVLGDQMRSEAVEKKWLDAATKIMLPNMKEDKRECLQLTDKEVKKYATYEKIYALVKYHISKDMFKNSGYSFSTIKTIHIEMYNYLYRPESPTKTLDKKVVDKLLDQRVPVLKLPSDVIYERTCKRVVRIKVAQAPQDEKVTYKYIFAPVNKPVFIKYEVNNTPKQVEETKKGPIVKKINKDELLTYLFKNIKKLSRETLLGSKEMSVIAQSTRVQYINAVRRIVDGLPIRKQNYGWIEKFYQKSVLDTIKDKQETTTNVVPKNNIRTKQEVEVRADEPKTDKETMFGLMFEQDGKQHVMDVLHHSREFVEGVKSVYDNSGKDYKVKFIKIEVLQ